MNTLDTRTGLADLSLAMLDDLGPWVKCSSMGRTVEDGGSMWKLRQLQAQLSAAHTRVAELEAQAAQDKPSALEASF